MRIRTIKPEFFKHDELAALAPITRLLFIGLWCLADRDGRLEDRPARIKVEVLPYDKIDTEQALSELERAGFIIRYSAEGLAIIQVANFSRHQRITGKEAETPSRFPAISQRETVEQLGNIGETLGKHLRRQEGKGKEGKGNGQGKEDAQAPAPSAPLPFTSPDFAQAWSEFQQHRTEIRKPLKPTSSKAALRELQAMGEPRAIAALRHTVAKGWQGIREPEHAAARGINGANRHQMPAATAEDFAAAGPNGGWGADAEPDSP